MRPIVNLPRHGHMRKTDPSLKRMIAGMVDKELGKTSQAPRSMYSSGWFHHPWKPPLLKEKHKKPNLSLFKGLLTSYKTTGRMSFG